MLWLLTLFAAVVRVASLPGWVFAPMCLLYVPLRVAAWERGGRARHDYAGGFLFWWLAFSFLLEIHWLFPFGPAAALGMWWVAEGALYRLLRRRLAPALAAPLAVCVVEWARCQFPMGGLPWALLSMGLGQCEWALFLGRVVGESGMVVLVAAAGGALHALAQRRPPAHSLAALSMWVLTAGAAWLLPAVDAGQVPLRCLAIQPVISLSDKNKSWSGEDLLRRQTEVTAAALAAAPEQELLIWSETMFPLPVTGGGLGYITRPYWDADGEWRVDSAAQVLAAQGELAAAVGRRLAPGAAFLTGAHWYEAVEMREQRSPRASAAVLFATDGSLLGHTAKTELVPFGERMPWNGRFPGGEAVSFWIYRHFGLLPNWIAPARPELVRASVSGKEVALGLPICWENVFEAVFRRLAAAGAEAFVVLSNEAWYGTSEEMDQMVAATRWRAAECGRAVLRATNSGVTILVLAGGELGPELERGRTGWLAVDLPRSLPESATPYLRCGWLVLPLAAAIGLVLAISGLLVRPRLDPRNRHGYLAGWRP